MTRFFLPYTSSCNELNNIDVTRQAFLTAIVKNQQKHGNDFQYMQNASLETGIKH